MKVKKTFLIPVILYSIVGVSLMSCGTKINTIDDPSFDEEGYLLDDSASHRDTMVVKQPTKVKYYVEVSGSMNGFFRKGYATKFKTDVWSIFTWFERLSGPVNIMSNEGAIAGQISIKDFQPAMNAGSFESQSSTKVPVMLQSMLADLESGNGEVGILVSDMKYSPVGSVSPQALLEQYSSDVRNIIGESGLSLCLVGAISQYLDKTGNAICDKSPYYYLVIGKQEQVNWVKNMLVTLLEDNNSYVDAIESGMDYKSVSYTFGKADNCYQMDENQPTFIGFDQDFSDTCRITLKLDLSYCRRLMLEPVVLKNFLDIKSKYSKVAIDTITTDIDNHVNKTLYRKAIANVALKVYNMSSDADVIEWTLNYPESAPGLLTDFLGATSENEFDKSYSIENFIKGVFGGGIVSKWDKKPNKILISTKE